MTLSDYMILLLKPVPRWAGMCSASGELDDALILMHRQISSLKLTLDNKIDINIHKIKSKTQEKRAAE